MFTLFLWYAWSPLALRILTAIPIVCQLLYNFNRLFVLPITISSYDARNHEKYALALDKNFFMLIGSCLWNILFANPYCQREALMHYYLGVCKCAMYKSLMTALTSKHAGQKVSILQIMLLTSFACSVILWCKFQSNMYTLYSNQLYSSIVSSMDMALTRRQAIS